jgi:glycerophosphoryl diester phosphodiesterase
MKMNTKAMIVFTLLSVLATFPIVMAVSKMNSRSAYPQIISHRGASGYLPEHSLQAYQTAIDLKTDYIEPDLCLSKDG